MKLTGYVPGTKAWTKRRSRIICIEVHERIQEIVDGEVGPTRAKRILEKHLEVCTPCAHDAEELRQLKEAIARVACTADEQLVSKLQDLARKLCEEGEPSGE